MKIKCFGCGKVLKNLSWEEQMGENYPEIIYCENCRLKEGAKKE